MAFFKFLRPFKYGLIFLAMVGITSPLWSKGNSRFSTLELFNKVLFIIEHQYYRPVDAEKLIDGAINGMVQTLDPHSTFLDEEQYSKLEEDTSGEFAGIGIEVASKDGVMIIMAVLDDTPAYRAQLHPGDKIIEINHESLLGLNLAQVMEKMRGPVKSKFSLGILREGSPGILNFELERELIKVKAVKAEILQDDFLFTRLGQFQKDVGEELSNAITKAQKKRTTPLKGIILDLRSNPGGLLDEAVNVASIFLKDGVVVSIGPRDEKAKEIRYVKKTGFKELELPVVVLVNGASASASEIVAGALQDHQRAIIMGQTTFGKGSVQTVMKIDDKRGIKLTIAQYMTPKGRRIQALGIKPDIEFDQIAAAYNPFGQFFVREMDLRNHLTATEETPEEKAHREALEKQDRQLRMNNMQNAQKQKTERENEVSGPYQPQQDYQVLQAINYLKSFAVFKQMQVRP